MSVTKSNEIEEESKLQAVVIADIFNENFQPISADIPPALLPMVNSTMLDLTLQWLRRTFVDETIIYCKLKYYRQFEESCKNWLNRTVGMKIKLIPLENLNSIGDAMRDLYAKSLIKSDFILISGNVIGNLQIKDLVQIHRNQRKLHSSIVMSCVYLQYKGDYGEEHYSIATVMTHAQSNKLLLHIRPRSTLVLPAASLNAARDRGGVLYNRMCDPNVLICSEILPSLFSDNFDYDTKDSLINGILGQEDLMGYTINFIHDEKGYCLNVDNFAAYERLSLMLTSRELVPLRIEKSQSTDRMRYKIKVNPIMYYDESAVFNVDGIRHLTVIDAATVIHEGAKVQKSSIGKNCEIGDKSTLKFAFIQNNVKIGENCTLYKCYIGDGATILSGVTLENGVVIDNNVIVGPNVTVPMGTRLVSTQFNNGSAKTCGANIIGTQGKGLIYEPNFQKGLFYCRWGQKLSLEKEAAEFDATLEESEEEPDENEDNLSDDDNFEEFVREVKDSILNGLKENTDPENVILEINGSRHAFNVTLENVQKVVVKIALQAGEFRVGKSLTGDDLWQSVKQNLQSLGAIISNYMKKEKDQFTVLVAIEEHVCNEERYLILLQKILFELNQQMELLDDEVIVNWYNSEEHTDVFPNIQKNIQKFIDWLDEEEDSE